MVNRFPLVQNLSRWISGTPTMPKLNRDIGRKADSEKEKKPVIDIWTYAEPAGEEPDPLKRNILQWRRLITSVPDPLETFVGQSVDITGFVHQRFQDSPSQFVLARHIIRCCLADTVPLGLVIHTDADDNFETDTWLKIKGSFAKMSVSSKLALVVIPEQIDIISKPPKAYINGVF